MKANKKETDPWAWAKAWTSKTQKKKEAAKNVKRNEMRPADSDILSTRPPEYTDTMEHQEIPDDIQSRLICHVPDFVWSGEMVEDTPKAIMTNGVLLFADVSGFTALTEKYSNDKEGVSGLTNALNGYISAICQHILDNGGDILKFAGDAILALWKCERKDIADAIAIATATALDIQHKNDWKMTSVGVELRVKIAISAGKIYCTHVGMPGMMRHIAMSGNPVGEVNAAEKHCNSGDVVLSPNAYELCNRDIFKGYEVGDGRFKFLKVSFMTHKKFPKWTVESKYAARYGTEFSRFACSLEENNDLTKYIRGYISGTVQAKLDDNQELNYLSEIRQCSILFINLVFDLKEQRRDYTSKLGKTLQAAFAVVDGELRNYGGQLNKLFMFDKGCTFLAAFGLPGQKNEREAAFALECANKITKRMTREILELERVSIGVTTGSVYVGVIGHHERHEYSFLGPKVNMAARIMMAGYSGMVNCDALTMKCSDLSRDYFIPQPYKALKGIQDPGVIYQYLETAPPLTSYLRGALKPEYPILGRISEIDHIMGEMCSQDERTFVLIEGEKGIGKTRLLDEIVILSQNIDPDLHVVNIATSYDIMKDNFKIVRIIIEELLGIIESPDREIGSFASTEILEVLNGCKEAEFKQLLNPIMGTYFSGAACNFSANEELEMQGRMLQFMVKKCLDNFDKTVVVIDNGQFIDQLSWPILSSLADDIRANILIAIRPAKFHDTNNILSKMAYDEKNHLVRLAALGNEFYPALICQMLKVKQVSKTLAAGMMYRSYGNPGWLFILLKKLKDENIITVNELGLVKDEMYIPPKELTTPQNPCKSENRGTASELVKRGIGSSNIGSKSSRVLSKAISKSIVNRSALKRESEISKDEEKPQRNDDFKHPAMQNETIDLDEELYEATNDYRTTRKATAANEHKYKNVLKKIGGYYENILQEKEDQVEATELEAHVVAEFDTLNKFISQIHAPAVIRSFILEQMDRLPPSTQFVCKCAALVGVYFSRQIIFSLVSAPQDRVNKAFRQLIEAKIIEPITSTVSQAVDMNPRATRTSCRRDSSLVNQIKIKTGYECDHLRFKNAFFREVIDQLWLNEHRVTLHHSCAEYFKRCIDELRKGKQISESTIVEFAVNHQNTKDTLSRQMSICKILRIDLDCFDERNIKYDKSRVKDKLMLDDTGLGTIFTMGKHVEDASIIKTMQDTPEIKDKRLEAVFGKDSFIWTRLARVKGTVPVETELFLSVLCPVLINHYMAGKKTEQAMNFLLDAAEAYLKIDSLKNALSNLDKVKEIISNLDNGYDIVKDVKNGDDDFLNLDVTVQTLKVPRRTRARYEMLMGDAHVIQGNLTESRKCYNKALKFSDDKVNFQVSLSLACAAFRTRKNDDGLLKLWNRIAKQEVCRNRKINKRFISLAIKRLRSLTREGEPIQVISANTNMLAMAHLGKLEMEMARGELQTLNEIEELESLNYTHVLKIFRFLHTSFFNRLSLGQIDYAMDLAMCLVQLGDSCGCKLLQLIARCSLCEIHLLRNDQKELKELIRETEVRMLGMGEYCPEVQCWLTMIKINLILHTGKQPRESFAQLLCWLLPFGSSVFSNLQWTALATMIAAVNIRICQFDAAFDWLTVADENRESCPASYFQAMSLCWRAESDLVIFRNSLAHLKMDDWSFQKGKEEKQFIETLKQFNSVSQTFVLFRPYYHMFQAVYLCLTKGTAKDEFKKAADLALQVNHVPAQKVIEATRKYYEEGEDSHLYKWTTRLIYTGLFEKEDTQSKDTFYIIPKA